jgi:tRNA(Ile)-lysidine synthase
MIKKPLKVMDPIISKVMRAVGCMVSPGDRVVAAVSGGVDSVVMIHLLKEMMVNTRPFELAIAHLNHLTRGEDSREDAAFVARLGETLGLETFIEEIDVGVEKKRMKTSFQEAARIVRYEFLERILKQWGGTWIALGHTADDQVETVLMNLLRGSGTRGLSGMPPQRDRLIRPLYECFRHEVEAYINRRGLVFRSDTTNRSDDYLRNRVRRELVPLLECYNPQVKSTLIETSRIMNDDEECLQGLVDRLYAGVKVERVENGLLALDVDTINAQHPALQKRLVRQAIREARGDLRRIGARHIQDLLVLFDAAASGKEIHLPGGLAVICTGKSVIFYETLPEENDILPEGQENAPVEIKVPGWTDIGVAGMKLHAELMSPEDFYKRSFSSRQACLDFDKTGPIIQTRFFRPGDRFIPLGMKKSKKLKSFFIDEKIPRAERKSVPLLTTGDGDIIWIYGKRIAETYRVTDGTRNVLFVEGVTE